MGPQEQPPVPQQPAPQPLPEPVQPVQPMQPQQSQFGGGLQQPVMSSQPQMAPMATQQPFGPQQFGTNPAVMPQMPPKSKKGLIIGLVAGGVGLLLLIVGVILAVLFLGPPSKADYQKAYDKANGMVTQYGDLEAKTDFSNLTSVSEVKQKFTELKATYDKENSELAGMKAFNDTDVKKAFNDYKQKYDAAMPVLDAMLTMSVACNSDSTSLSNISNAKTKQEALDAFDSATKDCLPTLKEMSSSSNSDIATYGKTLYDYMNALRTYYGDIIGAYASKDYATASKLKFPTSSTTQALNVSSDKYNFSKAFDTLTSLLHDKANK